MALAETVSKIKKFLDPIRSMLVEVLLECNNRIVNGPFDDEHRELRHSHVDQYDQDNHLHPPSIDGLAVHRPNDELRPGTML
jgi:hypothetical protein